MRAVVMRDRRLTVAEVDDPVPAAGQVLVETIACGICGSDKQALDFTDEFLQSSRDSGVSTFLFDPARDVVMGHELSARVISAGPDTPHTEGQVVVALPWALDGAGKVHGVGFSNEFPGGYGEKMVLQAMALEPVPEHVPPHVAALTEPLAVGYGNVARTGIGPGGSGIVVGCGPVGLGAVAALAERGVAPIVASEPSKLRRDTALRLGAHRAVDPAVEDPVEVWKTLAEPGQLLHVWVCTAVPGMINDLMYKVPRQTRILQIGGLMTEDVIRPIVGIYKDIVLEMCMVYPHEEYAETLRRIADGRIDAASLITGQVGLAGVAGAIDLLHHPDDHIQVLIRPGLPGTGIHSPD